MASVYPGPNTGYAPFPFAGGGLCPGDSVKVDAGGVLLRFARVVSLDQNGDLLVDADDIAIVRSKVGTTDPTADFDGDGQVTTVDVALVQEHLGHQAPDAGSTAVRPATWGRLKLLYR